MRSRILLACFIAGAADLAWAVFVLALVEHGTVHPWLRYAMPVLLVAGLGIWAHAAICWLRVRRAERAAGSAPATLARLHAPLSLEAPARDRLHRSSDLLARDGR